MKVKRLTETAVVPKRAHATDAGLDLYADIADSIQLLPHTATKVGTGIAIELEDGKAGLVYARSGLATKKGLRPANAVGVIDSSYRGEVIVALHNDTNYTQKVEPYERIAQLVITPISLEEIEEVDALSTTERGEGGFGSSGRK